MNPIERAIILEEAKQYTDSQRLARIIKSSSTLIADGTGFVFEPNPEYGNLPVQVVSASFGSGADLEYIVWWDGVEYRNSYDISIGSSRIGNMSLIGDGDDTGEPFAILNDYSQNVMLVIAAEPGLHKYRIQRNFKVIIPIDQKFIPPMDSIILNGADGKQYKLSVNESGELVTEATT